MPSPDSPSSNDNTPAAGGYDPGRVEANRQRLQGGALGARDLDRQQDPAGSGADSPQGEGGADGVERIKGGETLPESEQDA